MGTAASNHTSPIPTSTMWLFGCGGREQQQFHKGFSKGLRINLGCRCEKLATCNACQLQVAFAAARAAVLNWVTLWKHSRALSVPHQKPRRLFPGNIELAHVKVNDACRGMAREPLDAARVPHPARSGVLQVTWNATAQSFFDVRHSVGQHAVGRLNLCGVGGRQVRQPKQAWVLIRPQCRRHAGVGRRPASPRPRLAGQVDAQGADLRQHGFHGQNGLPRGQVVGLVVRQVDHSRGRPGPGGGRREGPLPTVEAEDRLALDGGLGQPPSWNQRPKCKRTCSEYRKRLGGVRLSSC